MQIYRTEVGNLTQDVTGQTCIWDTPVSVLSKEPGVLTKSYCHSLQPNVGLVPPNRSLLLSSKPIPSSVFMTILTLH
jgi:hypothetical protein